MTSDTPDPVCPDCGGEYAILGEEDARGAPACPSPKPREYKTIITHRGCNTPIFEVDGILDRGRMILAAEWHPLRPEWAQPASGDVCLCPNCGAGFVTSDVDLKRDVVER